MWESGVDKALLLSVPELAWDAESGDKTHMAMNFLLSKQGRGTSLFTKLHLAEISAASIAYYSQFYPMLLCMEH